LPSVLKEINTRIIYSPVCKFAKLSMTSTNSCLFFSVLSTCYLCSCCSTNLEVL